MVNPYKEYLDVFFSTLLDFRHSTNRLNAVLKKDVEIYTKEGSQIFLGSALIISDWSGPTSKTSEINFPTGVLKETLESTYESEIKKLISRECCLMYAQSFEALERFLKDCLFDKAKRYVEFERYIISLYKNQETQYDFKRETMPSGDKLFKVLKRAGGVTFPRYSQKNNLKIKFKELWTILSKARHAITHSRSIIRISELNSTIHHSAIFNMLFNSTTIDNNSILIELDYNKFEKLIKRVAEFAYQILKILSIEEEIKWEIYNTDNNGKNPNFSFQK